jgi:hypothetical protein
VDVRYTNLYLRKSLLVASEKCKVNSTTTTKKKVRLQERETALRRKIARFLPLQAIYMPHVAAFRQVRVLGTSTPVTESETPFTSPSTLPKGDDDESDDELDNIDIGVDGDRLGNGSEPPLIALLGSGPVHEIDLMLPSSLPRDLLKKTSPTLVQKELRLRKGQMESALAQLRRLVAIRAGLYLDKKASSRGQREGTRSTTLLQTYDATVKRTANHYRTVRERALKIDPKGDWQKRFLSLSDSDVRAGAEIDEEERKGKKRKRGTGEGHRELSWIWKLNRETGDESTRNSDGSDDSSEDILASGMLRTIRDIYL